MKSDIIKHGGNRVGAGRPKNPDSIRSQLAKAALGEKGVPYKHPRTAYEVWSGTFIRMLRQERAPIRLGDEMLNLIGIDNGNDVAPDAEQQVEGDRRLQQLKALIMPDTVNILLIHSPQTFGDRELGIDLTLAGHARGGGQLSLDFIHRGLTLGSLVGVPCIRGLYKNGGEQLYMNRGIGITGLPIRVGARTEIPTL